MVRGGVECCGAGKLAVLSSHVIVERTQELIAEGCGVSSPAQQMHTFLSGKEF